MKSLENSIFKNKTLVLLCAVICMFLTNSCDKDENEVLGEIIDEEVTNPNEEETQSLTRFQRETISYFTDIALGFEFGNESEITRKWKTNLNIYVHGNGSNQELIDELNRIIVEINVLTTDGFEINIVGSKQESNYEIFFGSHLDYGTLYPDLASIIVENWGYFNISFNARNEFTAGKMYVDTQRANVVEQKHLLREEFTQSLGFAKDSEQYDDSIFQQRWTTVTAFSDLDKELIRLLYHPDMRIGLDENNVDDLLKDILLAE